jgi:4-alpha-glucanotransferase
MAEPGRFASGRHAGILMPLFSIPSRASWGVGEIADLARLAEWLRQTGLDFVQLLPVNEMEEGQNSPYSALSAMAIDPVFIAPEEVPELAGNGDILDAGDRDRLERVRRTTAIDYRSVRALKARALHSAFVVFRERHFGADTDRDRGFRQFVDRHRWWLDDYALFRALHDEHRGAYWREWEPALRDRHPEALAGARTRLEASILFYQYQQWIADDQWRRARHDCGGIGLFGDFPFMVSGHSADVWARQHEFHLDASVGVPPDPFSPDGQDWGLPPYRWEVMAGNDYEWLRQRIWRCTELYDGFRIDHLVGFYRTYIRERDGHRYFSPGEERAQLAQGERLMRLFADSGARIVVEDLGVVPDFVRESLARLDVPGLKVLRWERRWHDPGQPFRHPADDYPPASVAISATHDTDMLAEWWDSAGADERRLCAAIPGLREAGCDPDRPFSAATRDALLAVLFHARSDLVIVPIQDVFGWRDRVNVPGVVDEQNWTWRMPWPIDTLRAQPEAQERARFLRALVERSGR